MRLLLARHGQTRNNAEGRIQGPLLDAPLNETGWTQAEQLAASLASRKVDAVYSSPLRRARQTALVAASALKLPIAGTLPEMREFSWGDLDGKVREGEVAAAFAEIVARWRAGETAVRAPNGDSPEWVWSRARVALAKLAARHEGQTVLVVAHARVNMIVLAGLLHGDISRMEDFDLPTGGFQEVDAPLKLLDPEAASDARGAADVQRPGAVPEPRRL